MSRVRIAAFVVVTLSCTNVFAEVDPVVWSDVPIIKHSTYQAVNDAGQSMYPSDGFPLRLRGVLLNNPEDWLDATFQDPPMGPGGQWEVFVQAVNLDDTRHDPYDDSTFNDFGGTAAWMGQNYAFLPGKPDHFFYDEAQWAAELTRLNSAGGTAGSDPIRAGDLIELRARGGKNFQGKMNVNEQHDTDHDRMDNWDGLGTPGDGENHDFEIVLLEQGFGRPAAQPLTLDTFKDSSDQYIFDADRETGGERYQSTWVELQNVKLVDDPDDWGSDADLTLTDATGRTLPIHLGMNDSFDTALAPDGWFNVSGIINQGGSDTGGYYLLALDAGDFVPEPASLVLLVGGGVLIGIRRNRGRA
ncbi:MAG: PEP-CTERM sorting domain-containing protein [Planctomycetes bacterium]|jgi:hypothetical protein|nr:PEP-CTERM sorting domain-containing protein [Planctomycetota bacterium]